MKAGSRRAKALLKLTSRENDSRDVSNQQKQRQRGINVATATAAVDSDCSKKLHRTGSWPPLRPPPSSLVINEQGSQNTRKQEQEQDQEQEQEQEQEQHKENRPRPPFKAKASSMSASSSSSSCLSLDGLGEYSNKQKPMVIPPPTWALPNAFTSSPAYASVSSSAMNAAPSPQAAMEMDTQQKETDSDLNQQPILRSASLTCILDELSEQADHKRGKSNEYYGLVEVGSSSYDNADASLNTRMANSLVRNE